MEIDLKSPHPVDSKTIRKIKSKEWIAEFLIKRRFWLGGKRLYGVALALERKANQIVALCNGHMRNLALGEKLEKHEPEAMGYTPTQEVETLLLYRNEVFGKMPVPTREYHRDQIETISALLDEDLEIKWVVNFGVAYGHVDAMLAKKYPAVQFFGVDRSPFVKALNEVDFSDVPNLTFVASDIVDFLKGTSGKGLFFHARTACLLHTDDMVNIYKQARKYNVAVVAGFEPHGVSRTSFNEFKYSLFGSPISKPYRRSMYLHDYPLMLKFASFSVTEFRFQKLPSPDGDGSKLTFVAKRSAATMHT